MPQKLEIAVDNADLELDSETGKVLAALVLKRREGERVNDRFDVDERDCKAVRENLPLAAHEDIARFKYAERIALSGELTEALSGFVDPEILLEIVGIATRVAVARASDRRSSEIVTSYLDRRRSMKDVANENYLNDIAVDCLDQAMISPEPEKALASIAFIFIDADGLKTVNDFSSYEQGDEFLRRIVEKLNDPRGPTRLKFAQRGVKEFTFASIGGDEFGFVIKAKEPISPGLLDEIIISFQDEVREINMADLINFKSDKFLLHFAGIGEKEFARYTPENKRLCLEAIRARIPEGASFYASFAAGGVTFLDALRNETISNHGKKLNVKKDSYGAALEKIRAQAKGIANNVESARKTDYKNSLRSSTNPADQFRAELLSRNLESRASLARIRDLKNEIRAKIFNAEFSIQFKESDRSEVDPAKVVEARKSLNPSNLVIDLDKLGEGESFNMMEHTLKPGKVPTAKKRR